MRLRRGHASCSHRAVTSPPKSTPHLFILWLIRQTDSFVASLMTDRCLILSSYFSVPNTISLAIQMLGQMLARLTPSLSWRTSPKKSSIYGGVCNITHCFVIPFCTACSGRVGSPITSPTIRTLWKTDLLRLRNAFCWKNCLISKMYGQITNNHLRIRHKFSWTFYCVNQIHFCVTEMHFCYFNKITKFSLLLIFLCNSDTQLLYKYFPTNLCRYFLP